MKNHLADEQFTRYRSNGMSMGEMAEVDEHLSDCDICRLRLLEGSSVPLLTAGLLRSLLPDPGLEERHLSAEALSDYLDARLQPDEMRGADRHLERCEACREVLADLRKFRAEMSVYPDREYLPEASARKLDRLTHFWKRPLVWMPAYSLAIAAVAVVFALRVRPEGPGPEGPDVAALRAEIAQLQAREQSLSRQIGQSDSQSMAVTELRQEREKDAARLKKLSADLERLKRENEALTHADRRNAPSRTPEGASPSAIAQLVDGGKKLLLFRDDRGEMVLARPLSGGQLLASNDLGVTVDPDLKLLIGGSNRGGSDSEISPVSPVDVTVESLRPEFRWRETSGVDTLKVVVYAGLSGDTVIRESPPLAPESTSWKCDVDLDRGKIYRWLIRGYQGDAVVKRLTAVRIKVISSRDLELLRAARESGSHLALGLAYARSGQIDLARAELQLLQRDNPGAELPRRLLRSLPSPRE